MNIDFRILTLVLNIKHLFLQGLIGERAPADYTVFFFLAFP